MSTFAENLKSQRKKKNLSQEDLGKLIGVTGVTIMRYEKGLREPKLEIIKKIANALKIPVANLIDINSPILSKATKKFISGKQNPDDIETYGDVMDDIVMNSPVGPIINDYQTSLAELNNLRFELISICYRSLDEEGKNHLYKYACQLLENSEEFKQAIKKYNIQLPNDDASNSKN